MANRQDTSALNLSDLKRPLLPPRPPVLPDRAPISLTASSTSAAVPAAPASHRNPLFSGSSPSVASSPPLSLFPPVPPFGLSSNPPAPTSASSRSPQTSPFSLFRSLFLSSNPRLTSQEPESGSTTIGPNLVGSGIPKQVDLPKTVRFESLSSPTLPSLIQGIRPIKTQSAGSTLPFGSGVQPGLGHSLSGSQPDLSGTKPVLTEPSGEVSERIGSGRFAGSLYGSVSSVPPPPAFDGGLGKKKRTPSARSWIRIDPTGECHVLEMDKMAIMRRCDLPARDLRLLDPLFVYPATILGREKAIVLNLESIRCIVTADEVLLLNIPDTPVVQEFKKEFQRRLFLGNHSSSQMTWKPVTEQFPTDSGAESSENTMHEMPTVLPVQRKELSTEELIQGSTPSEEDLLPFEFRAVELALEFACSGLDAQASLLEREAYPLLQQLAYKINTSNLELVRRLKSSLLALTRRVQKVRDEVEQLMDDDGDMAEMYLSAKKAKELALLQSAMAQSQQQLQHPQLSRLVSDRFGGHNVRTSSQFVETPKSSLAPSFSFTRGFHSGSLSGHGYASAPVSPRGSPVKTASAEHLPGISSPTESKGEFGFAPSLWGGTLHSSHSPRSSPGSRADNSDSLSSSSTREGIERVEELEMLLEAYFVVIDGTLNKLLQLSQYIDDTEDFINIQLDNVRNQLIQYELIMTTAAFVVGIWGVIAGVFGMNVPLGGVEESPSALLWILVVSGSGGVTIFLCFLAYFRYKNWTIT